MDITNLKKCAERQHKATAAIVQNLVGLPLPLISTFPFVTKRGTTLFFFAPSQARVDSDFINPYVMNGSFALELKMKYLYALETGTKMDQGHRLKAIFGALTQDSRDAIHEQFDKVVRSPLHKHVTKTFNEECKVQFRWKLEYLLEKANLAFERWRYIYEGDDTSWFAGYSEMLFAINARIAALESQQAAGASGAA